MLLGYENEEEVSLKCLEMSKGAAARRQQTTEAAIAAGSSETSGDETESKVVPEASPKKPATATPSVRLGAGPRPSPFAVPPPPPPAVWPKGEMTAGQDPDALYSMLMSWYMAGYHTGKPNRSVSII